MPSHYGDKKNGNGLTKKQKTLPKALQRKIMESKKKKMGKSRMSY